MTFALSALVFYAAAACCLFRSTRLLGLSAAALLFAGALVYALVSGPGGSPCGCFGSTFLLAWKEQVRLAILSGALASLLLWWDAGREPAIHSLAPQT